MARYTRSRSGGRKSRSSTTRRRSARPAGRTRAVYGRRGGVRAGRAVAPRQQIIRIQVEAAPSSPAAVPAYLPAHGLNRVAVAGKKARF